MPHWYVLRLFVGFKGANFEKGPMLTFVPTTLHSLVWVASFGGVETASANHSLVGISPSFHSKQSSLHHPQLMIDFWRVLTSLVIPIDDVNVGVEPIGVRFVQLHWSQANFYPCSCFLRSLSNFAGVSSTSLELDELLPCIERCLYGWSWHAPLKLKSNEDNSNYFGRR